jgi:hypothetical protein
MQQVPLQVATTIKISILYVPHPSDGTAIVTMRRAIWGQLETKAKCSAWLTSSFMAKTWYNVLAFEFDQFRAKTTKIKKPKQASTPQVPAALPDRLVACSTTEGEQVHNTNTPHAPHSQTHQRTTALAHSVPPPPAVAARPVYSKARTSAVCQI